MRYAFMREHRNQWAVSLMAEVLAVSVSGFYSWLRRSKSRRAEEDQALTGKIVMFHCGSPRTGRARPFGASSLYLWLATYP